MTQADFGAALMLFLVVLGFALYNWFGPLRYERIKTYRYRLFAVRDKLVRLVAEEKISEEDPTFQFLYVGINHVIPRVKPLTLRAIVEALNTSSLLEEKAKKKFLGAVFHNDPAVRVVARELFLTLGDILFARSLFIRAAIHLAYKPTLPARWARSRILKTRTEAYNLHRIVDGTSRDLSNDGVPV